MHVTARRIDARLGASRGDAGANARAGATATRGNMSASGVRARGRAATGGARAGAARSDVDVSAARGRVHVDRYVCAHSIDSERLSIEIESGTISMKMCACCFQIKHRIQRLVASRQSTTR